MRRWALAAPLFLLAHVAQAQQVFGGTGVTSINGQSGAVSLSIPTPLSAVPPASTPAGAVGTSNTYVPGDAIAPGLVRATTVTTTATGAWSVTWSTPFVSATPTVNVIPINSGSQPAICNVTSRSATSAAGQCWMQATQLLNLSIVTTGLTLNLSNANTGAISVMIIGREPTQ